MTFGGGAQYDEECMNGDPVESPVFQPFRGEADRDALVFGIGDEWIPGWGTAMPPPIAVGIRSSRWRSADTMAFFSIPAGVAMSSTALRITSAMVPPSIK